ncbi:MAG: hypothetical protein ACI906_004034, partial [Candidatus Latescibacterota bacterium]
MSSSASRLKRADSEFFAREIETFLPARIFDAHTHLWKREFAEWQIEGTPADIGYKEYLALMQDLHPERRIAALFIPSVQADTDDSFAGPNAWIARATTQASDCRGLFFVRPTDDPEWVRQEVRRLGAHGLKC